MTTPVPASSSFQLNRPTVVALLYLGGFITGITVIIGLVLSYMWQKEPLEPWEASHYRWHIRTFWIGLVYSLICTLLYIAVAVWFAVRAIKALLAAQRQEPIMAVESWLL
jgi:uncharacterized membrane protein